MIRQNDATSSKLVFCAIVLCIVSAGMPPVFASSWERPTGRYPAEFANTGNAPAGMFLTPARLEEMRLIAISLQGSPTPKLRERGKRLSRWVGILVAKTPAERHDAIRRLPVTIIESVPTDGREGVVKRFIAEGKTRLEIFVRTARPIPEGEVEEHLLGGPNGAGGPSRDDCYYEGEPSACVTQQDLDDLGVLIADAEVEIESQQMITT